MTCHIFEIEIPIILIDVVNTYFLSKKPQVVKLELFMRKFNFMQIRKRSYLLLKKLKNLLHVDVTEYIGI